MPPIFGRRSICDKKGMENLYKLMTDENIRVDIQACICINLPQTFFLMKRRGTHHALQFWVGFISYGRFCLNNRGLNHISTTRNACFHKINMLLCWCFFFTSLSPARRMQQTFSRYATTSILVKRSCAISASIVHQLMVIGESEVSWRFFHH